MSSRDWTQTSKSPPPEGVLVETMKSSGEVSDLVRKGNLFFIPDLSMYVYYEPVFWRMRENSDV